MTKSNIENSLMSNTIETFKNIVGYDLFSFRVVFEHEGDEIVFINEGWIGRVRIYLNGRLAYSGWDWSGMASSEGWFLHEGKTYKIVSKVSNLLTFAQRLTLSIDGEEVTSKTDAFFGKLTMKEVGHLVLGSAFIGFLIIAPLKLLGL